MTRVAWHRFGDPLLAGLLVVLGECELFIRSLDAEFHGPRPLNAVLVVAIAAPVAWRRVAPLVAFVAYLVPASVWLDAVYGPNSSLPVEPLLVLLILIYSAASYATAERQRWVFATVSALFASELVLLAVGTKSVGNVVPGLLLIGLAYVVGRALRSKHVQAEAIRREAAGLEMEAAERTRRAVAAERDRIARELHDVIAHSVSVMVVQAGAGERLLAIEPARARESLEAIRRAGGEALDELRRLLGLLREQSPTTASVEPQPGLRHLEALVDQARAAGLSVECQVRGDREGVPPGVDLAAYRIVQEALTNARKHGGQTAAEVEVEYQRRAVRVVVTDNGLGSSTIGVLRGAGHGLIGMRERVAVYGGLLETGPRAGGGFAVRATIPFDGAPT